MYSLQVRKKLCCYQSDTFAFDLVHQLNHKETEMEVTVERDFVDILEGGGNVAIGVNAKVMGNGEVTAQCSQGLTNAAEIIDENMVVRESM